MSKILTTENQKGKKVLKYYYQSAQDVDDIILQLLNESSQEGFVKNSIDRKKKSVVYDVNGFSPLSETSYQINTEQELRRLFEDIRKKLVFLEDSFIDTEFVDFEPSEVFIDELTGKLYLIVLPCQLQGEQITDCQHLLEMIVKQMAGSLLETDTKIQLIYKRIQQGVTRLKELQEVIDLFDKSAEEIQEEPKKDKKWFSKTQGKAEMDILYSQNDQLEDEKNILFQFEQPIAKQIEDDFSGPEIIVPGITEEKNRHQEVGLIEIEVPEISAPEEKEVPELFIPEEIEIPEAGEPEEIEIPEADESEEIEIPEADEPEAIEQSESAVREEVQPEDEKSISGLEQLREEIYTEAEEKLRPMIEAELRPVIEQEMKEKLQVELRPFIEEEVRNEIQQEQKNISEQDKKDDETDTFSYLLRKKTSEIIPLKGESLVMGKERIICDYQITDTPSISRVHAIVRYDFESDESYILDCDSTNGVYVQGYKIRSYSPVKLNNNDRIHLATEEFIFHK